MNRRTVALAATGAAAALAAGMALALSTGSTPGGPGERPPRAAGDPARTGTAPTAPTAPTASPPSTAPSAPAPHAGTPPPPRTIPAVRSFTPAHGPGWRPAGGRIVVTDDRLADEGRLLAGELRLRYAGRTGARAGDVELALGGTSGGWGPLSWDISDAFHAVGESAGGESYTLTVRGGRVHIAGRTDAGVFYGTRTLKQMVHRGATAPEGVVRDTPAKPQRGLMLDIARKPYTEGWIEDRIRELGDLKFNQLGLHFSDDQGFRIASATHPEIVSPNHLSKAQVRRILALAASRHITVVPEIDSPGHLGAVIAAHPELQLRTGDGRAAIGAVDITDPAAARIVDDLLKEYAGLFRGRYWHLGGDEYVALMSRDPEATYPKLAAAARRAYGGKGRIQDLVTAWLNDRAATLRPFHRSPRAWNDGFFPGGRVTPDERLDVAYWTGREPGERPPEELLRAGRRLITYNDEYLYYVLGQPHGYRYPTGRRIHDDWTPRVVRGTKAVPRRYDKQILGGTFAVWGDVPDAQTQTQVAAGIFLPLRAVAQKLWDPGPPPLSWNGFTALARRLGD